MDTDICGAVEEHGGRYEWRCMKPPHDPKDIPFPMHNKPPFKVNNHVFHAFKKEL